MGAIKFEVIFTPSSQCEIESLEPDDVLQLAKDIKTYLETSPLPFGKSRIKKLTAFNPPLYRLRSGNFRAYYRILSHEIVILALTHKKDSEKILKKLKA